MTSLPLDRLLTIAEYAEFGENERGRYELQEGRLVMSPNPASDHMIALARMFAQLEGQLPARYRVVPDVDLDLQLAPPGQPGWPRRPDLVIVTQTALERMRLDGGLLRAEDTKVVVEIVSPGSRRTDNVIKRGEYAGAGIDHYWIFVTVVILYLLGIHPMRGPGARRLLTSGGDGDQTWIPRVNSPRWRRRPRGF